MGDPAALQEAIQRARQLAAKMSQNAPIKRPASELDDHVITGQVKVTLAYEKPANSDRGDQRSRNRESSVGSGGFANESSNRERDRDRDRERDRERGHDREERAPRDRERGGSSHNPSNNFDNGGSIHQKGPTSYGGPGSGVLTGANAFPAGGEDKLEMIIPHAAIGLVIGKGGENIKRIQNETGANVRVDPNTIDEKGNKMCTITGSKKAVEEAHVQINQVIETAGTNKRPRMQMDGADEYKMKIPAQKTGAIIGRGGETIKSIKQQSGCDIELDKNSKECGPGESVFIIRGSQDKISKARSLIEARLASRGRDSDNRGSSRTRDSGPKGAATGANAVPVASYPELGTPTYSAPAMAVAAAPGAPVAGQQNSADMNAAWQAYFAQYSTMFNQAGGAPGAAAAMGAGAPAMPYGQQLLASADGMAAAAAAADPMMAAQQHMQQQQAQQMAGAGAAGQQQDYTDQWIEFYMMSGRPDYAEQVIEMKKQAQKQQQQQQHHH